MRDPQKKQCEKVKTALRARGYRCEPCQTDDADLIVHPPNGRDAFKLQVCGGLAFAFKNEKRGNIHVAFCNGGKVYCYPHNETLKAFIDSGKVDTCRSWKQQGHWFTSNPSRKATKLLETLCILHRTS